MKVNRKKLEQFLKTIQATKKDLTNEELANKLASWIETNPGCIEMEEISHSGRYSYSTVGYGVFSLLGEFYRMGRIEVFDSKDKSGYAIEEGSYCMPHIAANQFEDFIESLETDMPIQINLGLVADCEQSVSKELGIPPNLLNDTETKKKFYAEKNEKYAQDTYGVSWEEHTKNVLENLKKNNKQ